MIFINPDRVSINEDWKTDSQSLTDQLKQKLPSERNDFIEAHRLDTWRHPSVLTALRSVVGNKCWYSEVQLDGADVDVDHFRPKGAVREVDEKLQNTGSSSQGYWWLAFDHHNFRLSSKHSNQRRVDEHTDGGKWDYFPVRGTRTPTETEWGCIIEDKLALDPCSSSDVRLIWFDPEGHPCCARRNGNEANDWDKRRVKATIWLYHLDKHEIQLSRAKQVDEILKDVKKADASYKLWMPDSSIPNLQAKNSFDQKIAEIHTKLLDTAIFAGAKRSVVRQATAKYPWIEEHISL